MIFTKLINWFNRKKQNTTELQYNPDDVAFPKGFDPQTVDTNQVSEILHPLSEILNPPKPPNTQSLADITFSILDNGNIYINCQWTEDMVAPAYGELLYKINNGDFTGEIIDILVGHLVDAPQDGEIVGEIINCWRMIKDSQKNQPLISPSSVFDTAQQMPMPPDMEEME